MSFDESGYILYPRASQTQQVPAYDFQVSIPDWRSSVPKYPSLPNDTRSQAVFPQRPAGTKTAVALKGESRLYLVRGMSDSRPPETKESNRIRDTSQGWC
jgi:hypothetical protein